MTNVRYTVIHHVEIHMLSPVHDAMVRLKSGTTAEASKPTIFDFSRSRFSWISISMMNFHQNVSTFKNLSCTTTPVPPAIRNISSENHPVLHPEPPLLVLFMQKGPLGQIKFMPIALSSRLI
jgi:hypothetical protein